MIRITQFAIRQKSVDAASRRRSVPERPVRVGQLQQELLPDIELPIVTRHLHAARRRRRGRGDPGHRAHRAVARQRAAAGAAPVDVGQLAVAGHRPVRVRDRHQGDARHHRASSSTVHPARGHRAAGHGAQHQRPAGRHRDASARPRAATRSAAARIARTVLLPEVRSRGRRVARRTSPAVRRRRSSITARPGRHGRSAGVSLAAGHGRPPGQPGDHPVGNRQPPRGSRCPVTTSHRFRSTRGAPGRSSWVGSRSADARPTPVTLGEIADVELVEVQHSGYARTNGQPSLTLTVSKASGANTVEVADAVQADVRGRRGALPRPDPRRDHRRTSRCSSRSRATAWSARDCWAPPSRS